MRIFIFSEDIAWFLLIDKRNLFNMDFKSISLHYFVIPLIKRLSEHLISLSWLVVIGGPLGYIDSPRNYCRLHLRQNWPQQNISASIYMKRWVIFNIARKHNAMEMLYHGKIFNFVRKCGWNFIILIFENQKEWSNTWSNVKNLNGL